MFLLFISLALGKQIYDGKTEIGTLSESISTEVLFSYQVSVYDSDLLVFVTCFSDYSDPYIYFHNSSNVSESNYLLFSSSRNEAFLRIPFSQLHPNVYILLHCQNYCSYSLSVSQSEPIELGHGVPFTNTLEEQDALIFSYKLTEMSQFLLVTSNYVGYLKMFVSKNEKIPDANNTLQVLTNWVDDLECYTKDISTNDIIYIKIIAVKRTEFSILVQDNAEVPIKLQASKEITDTIHLQDCKFYYIEISDQASHLEISMSVFRGYSEIYVSFSQQPNTTVHDFKSDPIGNHISISKKDFEKFKFAAGKVFITIHGTMDSKFSFVVRTNQLSTVELSDGVPQESFIKANEIQNFYYKVSDVGQNLTFYLTTYHGDTQLYVRFCLNKCLVGFDDLESNKIFKNKADSSLKTIEVNYQGNRFCSKAGCNFVVAVVSEKDSYYSVALVSKDEFIRLQQGKTFVVSSPVAGKQLFEYQITDETVYEVEFILSTVYGDPKMCSNLGVSQFGSCEKKSDKSGTQTNKITYEKGVDFDTLAGLYFISVECISGCYYSIVPREHIPGTNTTIHLIAGHPQRDTLLNTQSKNSRLYYFVITKYEDIKILLSSKTESFTIFVSNNQDSLDWGKSKFNYTWKANSSQGNANILTISTKDKDFKVNATYFVLVSAYSFNAEDTAEFTIQYTQGNQILMLTSDASILGNVQSYGYSYYSFPIHFSHIDLKISLTAISGNPDLYISFDPNNTHPNISNYHLKSTNFGSETLNLLWEDDISKYCPVLNTEYQHGEGHGCMLYLSVHSEFFSSFSLRILTQTNLPKYLQRQESVFDNLNKGEYEFFYTNVEVSGNLSIILQNVIGESELLITIRDKSNASEDLSEWQRPTDELSEFKVKNLLTEEIHLKPTILKKFCEKTCLVLIGSQCLTDTCSFLLEVTDSNIIKLTEGQPKYGIVGGDFQYYSYICDKVETLIIAVTPIESCNPSLYISKGENSRPTSSQYDWDSVSSFGDSVQIRVSDSRFSSESMVGTYIIGVTSEDGICTYTLTVTNHKIPFVLLTPGIPQKGTITNREPKYYFLFNLIAEKVSINLTPISGSPFIIVSVHFPNESEFYADLPTEKFFIWNSKFGTDKYSIQINSTDQHYCRNCYYLIGVFAEEDSSFLISATTETNIKVLQNGVPTKTEIFPNDLHIYKFKVNLNRRLHISVSEYSNSIDFNVSLSLDEQESIIWKANSSTNTKIVTIETTDPNFILGTYYVTISTTKPSTLYSIVWYNEESYIYLIDGWPLIYEANNDAPTEVKFQFKHSGYIFCMLETLTEKFYPKVSVYAYESSGKKILKTYSDLNYVSEHLNLEIYLEESQTMLIHVKNYRADAGKWGEFSIYCTKSFHPGVLAIGKTAIGHLNSNITSLRYEISVPAEKSLYIYVVPCIGIVNFQVSTNWTVIKDEKPLLLSARLVDGILFGVIKIDSGKIYLTVNNLSPGSSIYKILVEKNMGKRLYPGDDGFISWENHKDQTNIKWSALEYENGSKFEGNATYRLFYTENEDIELKTSCQVHYAASMNWGKWLGSTEQENLSIKTEKKGYINVLAAVNKNEEVVLKEVIYDKTSFESSGGKRSINRLLYLLVILVLLLLLGVGIYYCKYRKVKEEIKQHQTHGMKIQIDDTFTDQVVK